MIRFDDRLDPRDDNRTDFQRFAWQALQSAYFDPLVAGRYVRPYFSPGRDGKIDHVLVGDKNHIVVECKFYGKGRTRDKPETDWTEVAQALRKNLTHKNSVNRQGYKPWFQREYPIAGYWFCTSGLLTPPRQTELRQNIRKFFSKLAKEPLLAHLKDINVEVIAWNDFQGALAASPPLNYAWFKKLPRGLRPLNDSAGARTFKKFLEEDTLPFYSRKLFNEGASVESKLDDETLILSALMARNSKDLAILAGPGGVGKTRLALELGRRAESLGWLVLKAEQRISGEAIKDLTRDYTIAAKILIVADYAEAMTALSDVVQEILDANRDGEHQIRLIATCRASAVSVVREAFEGADHKFVYLPGTRNDAYGNWVVERIVHSLPHSQTIATICGGMPVLAAFALFLYREFPDKYDTQFASILAGDNFSRWAEKRLTVALRSRGIEPAHVRRPLATIAAQLPLKVNAYDQLRRSDERAAQLLSILLDDRWLEINGDEVVAVHDIFADALFTQYVFETTTSAEQRIADILSDAAVATWLGRTILALNRMAAHPDHKRLDGTSILRRLRLQIPEHLIAARATLLSLRLPNEGAVVDLLLEMPALVSAVASDPNCDLGVASLAKFISLSGLGVWRDSATRMIEECLDLAVERSHPVSLVARNAIGLSPLRYRHKAIEWIQKSPEQADYIIKEWLRAGGDFETVREAAISWFQSHAVAEKAVFLLKWLARERDLPSSVIDDMIGWCVLHSNNRDAISRIVSLASTFGSGPFVVMLVDSMFLVLEDVQVAELSEPMKRQAVQNALTWLYRTYKRMGWSNTRQLDECHFHFISETPLYKHSANACEEILGACDLAWHVVDMVTRCVVDPEVDLDDLLDLSRALSNFPTEHRTDVEVVFDLLKKTCPIEGAWRVDHLPDRAMVSASVQTQMRRLRREQAEIAELSKTSDQSALARIDESDAQLSVEDTRESLDSPSLQFKTWFKRWSQSRALFQLSEWIAFGMRRLDKESAGEKNKLGIVAPNWSRWIIIWENLMAAEPSIELIELGIAYLDRGIDHHYGQPSFVRMWKNLWVLIELRERIALIGLAWLEERQFTLQPAWNRIWSDIRTLGFHDAYLDELAFFRKERRDYSSEFLGDPTHFMNAK